MSLTRNQYNQIMRLYDERQSENRRIHKERLDEVKKRIPEWDALQAKLPSSSAARIRAMLFPESGPKEASLRTAASVSDIQKEKRDLLQRFGFPADYLDMTYHCPLCRDTGYIDRGVSGEFVSAAMEKCSCFKQLETQILYDQSGLTAVLEQENFDHFFFSYYSDRPEDAVNGCTPYQNMEKNIVPACMDFIRSFKSSSQNLLLYGNPGVGKTFLTNCIARELLNRSCSAVYLSAARLFDVCSDNAFRQGDVSDESLALYDSLLSCDLLIIDDLGTEMTNSFTVSSLFYIINERCLQKKSMIISTNLSLYDIRGTYGERIFSRITSGFRTLYLFGEDIRQKKQLAACD